MFGGGSLEEEVGLGRGLDRTGSEKVNIDVGRSEFRRPPLPVPGGDDCCPIFDSVVVVRPLWTNVRRECSEYTQGRLGFHCWEMKAREPGREMERDIPPACTSSCRNVRQVSTD